MAEQRFWQRILGAVERSYERRIRSASLVQEYGAAQHGDDEDDDEGEAAVIANVPRGTRVRARSQADQDHASEHALR